MFPFLTGYRLIQKTARGIWRPPDAHNAGFAPVLLMSTSTLQGDPVVQLLHNALGRPIQAKPTNKISANDDVEPTISFKSLVCAVVSHNTSATFRIAQFPCADLVSESISTPIDHIRRIWFDRGIDWLLGCIAGS